MSGIYDVAHWVNVLWAHDGGGGEVSVADLNAAAAFIGNAWGTNVISHMSDACLLQNCHVSFYGPPPDLLEGDATLTLSGGSVAVGMTSQVAATISWNVPVGYRGGHPRSYIAGVNTGMLINRSTFSGAFASTLAAGGNTFLTNVNGFTHGGLTDLKLVCMSFVRARAWRVPPVAIPIANAHVDVRVDTQRRRLGADLP